MGLRGASGRFAEAAGGVLLSCLRCCVSLPASPPHLTFSCFGDRRHSQDSRGIAASSTSHFSPWHVAPHSNARTTLLRVEPKAAPSRNQRTKARMPPSETRPPPPLHSLGSKSWKCKHTGSSTEHLKHPTFSIITPFFFLSRISRVIRIIQISTTTVESTDYCIYHRTPAGQALLGSAFRISARGYFPSVTVISLLMESRMLLHDGCFYSICILFDLLVLFSDFSVAFWALAGLWVGLVRDWGGECMAGTEILYKCVVFLAFD